MARISVIVPVYNAEKTLKKCVDSLLSQTFNDIEIILVDDGSNDKSAEICDKYANIDSRVKVFRNENHGVSFTRNFGIEKSDGKYIMFCDSDDSVEPDWCKAHFDAIEAYPGYWVISGVKSVREGEADTFQIFDSREDCSVLSVEEYFHIFKAGLSGYPVNHIYEREKLDGIRFNKDVSCGEDVLFNNEYLQKCDGIVCVNKALYNYVRQSDTLSTKYNRDFFYTHKPLYESRRKFIKEEYMPEFCKTYFYIFNEGLKATFDKRNTDGFFKKISYNNKILRDETFVECLNEADLSSENQNYIKMLKSGNYLRIYLIQKLYALKGGRRKG